MKSEINMSVQWSFSQLFEELQTLWRELRCNSYEKQTNLNNVAIVTTPYHHVTTPLTTMLPPRAPAQINALPEVDSVECYREFSLFHFRFRSINSHRMHPAYNATNL